MKTYAGHTALKVVRARSKSIGETSIADLSRNWGIDEHTVGSKDLNMAYSMIQPKGKTKPHAHANCETAIYIIKGRCKMYVGRDRELHNLEAGDFVYIPPGELHYAENPSETEPLEAVQAQNARSEETAGYIFEE